MGLFIRQDDKRSDLSERIAAELRERQRQAVEGPKPALDDQSKNATMLKDLHQTNLNGRVIAMTGIGITIVILYLLTN